MGNERFITHIAFDLRAAFKIRGKFLTSICSDFDFSNVLTYSVTY